MVAHLLAGFRIKVKHIMGKLLGDKGLSVLCTLWFA